MKKLLKQLTIFAIIAGVAMVSADAALAASQNSAGDSLFKDFIATITGTMGTTIGLAVSLIGLYMWIWNQVSWGIFVAIGGALLTAFPGIFESISGGAKTAFDNTIGDNTVNPGFRN